MKPWGGTWGSKGDELRLDIRALLDQAVSYGLSLQRERGRPSPSEIRGTFRRQLLSTRLDIDAPWRSRPLGASMSGTDDLSALNGVYSISKTRSSSAEHAQPTDVRSVTAMLGWHYGH